jgi:poly-gamma-glutamate synthesis protein (capsule biosynthesis protein)
MKTDHRSSAVRRRIVFFAIPLILSLSACTTMPDTRRSSRDTAQPSAETPRAIETSLRFAVAGDIMVHRAQLESAYDKKCDCYDFKPVFAPVRSLFRDVDVAIANLETTLPGRNYTGYPAFGSPDSLVDAIKASGINVLTTANNHSVDKGKHGLLRTIEVLQRKGIGQLGTYATLDEYREKRIYLVEKNGLRVALLNYTYGSNEIPTPKGTVLNRIDKDLIREDIALARAKKADAVIVLYHFGTEYLHKPDAFQKEMVKHAFVHGADIVIGGHPHHVQPYTAFSHEDEDGRVRPRLVVYSLGNFVSAQRRRYTDGGMVLYFTIRKRMENGSRVTLDITDVHHRLVWVYAKKLKNREQFYILPIETYLAKQTDIELSDWARAQMKRYRSDSELVLGRKEGARITATPERRLAMIE